MRSVGWYPEGMSGGMGGFTGAGSGALTKVEDVD